MSVHFWTGPTGKLGGPDRNGSVLHIWRTVTALIYILVGAAITGVPNFFGIPEVDDVAPINSIIESHTIADPHCNDFVPIVESISFHLAVKMLNLLIYILYTSCLFIVV